jgi:hypothetical protein
MTRRLATVALFFLALSGLATAAGTVVTTEITSSSARKVRFAWTSSAGGAADATTTAAFDGKVVGLTTDPDGVAIPTDNYDIAITDANGDDVLLGAGLNRDTAVTEHVAEASLGAVAGSKLTLAVTNAGNATQGVVVLFIR